MVGYSVLPEVHTKGTTEYSVFSAVDSPNAQAYPAFLAADTLRFSEVQSRYSGIPTVPWRIQCPRYSRVQSTGDTLESRLLQLDCPPSSQAPLKSACIVVLHVPNGGGGGPEAGTSHEAVTEEV